MYDYIIRILAILSQEDLYAIGIALVLILGFMAYKKMLIIFIATLLLSISTIGYLSFDMHQRIDELNTKIVTVNNKLNDVQDRLDASEEELLQILARQAASSLAFQAAKLKLNSTQNFHSDRVEGQTKKGISKMAKKIVAAAAPLIGWSAVLALGVDDFCDTMKTNHKMTNLFNDTNYEFDYGVCRDKALLEVKDMFKSSSWW